MDDDFRTKCMNEYVEVKVVLHRTMYFSQAIDWWKDFVRENDESIVRATNRGIPIAILDNGEEHHFVPNIAFKRWSRGRTYWFYGVLYHSDYPVKGMDDGTTT